MVVLTIEKCRKIDEINIRMKTSAMPSSLRIPKKSIRQLRGTVYDPKNEKILYKIAARLMERKSAAGKMRYLYETFALANDPGIKIEFCPGIIKDFRQEGIPFTAADLVDKTDDGTILLADGREVMFMAVSALRLSGSAAYPGGIYKKEQNGGVLSVFFEPCIAIVGKDNRLLASFLVSEETPQPPFEKLELLNDNEAPGLAEIVAARNMLERIRCRINAGNDAKCDTPDIKREVARLAGCLVVSDMLWKGNFYYESILLQLKSLLMQSYPPEHVEEAVRDIRKAVAEVKSR